MNHAIWEYRQGRMSPKDWVNIYGVIEVRVIAIDGAKETFMRSIDAVCVKFKAFFDDMRKTKAGSEQLIEWFGRCAHHREMVAVTALNQEIDVVWKAFDANGAHRVEIQAVEAQAQMLHIFPQIGQQQ